METKYIIAGRVDASMDNLVEAAKRVGADENPQSVRELEAAHNALTAIIVDLISFNEKVEDTVTKFKKHIGEK